MTDRPDASSITDDQLDALYARAEQAEARARELSAGCGQLSGAVHSNRRRAERAEARGDVLFLAAEDVHSELHALIAHGTAPGSAARAAWVGLDAALGPLRAAGR